MPSVWEKYTGKTGMELFTDATSAAKARLGAAVVKKQSQDPAVRADIKGGVGQKIGVWLIDNYMYILGGVAVLGVVWYFYKRR